ncbi:MAG TPA: phage tail assembly protein [Chthoniobacterales bacterium]
MAKRSLPLRLTCDPPIEYDGKTYKTLTFDFDALNRKRLDKIAKRKFNKMCKPEKFATAIALVANGRGVPVGLIMKLPIRYSRLLHSELFKFLDETEIEVR